MRNPVQPTQPNRGTSAGLTLIELMIATSILAVAIFTVTSIMVQSSRLQQRTARRADVQADCRQMMSLMTTELRQAGADPGNPPLGLAGIVAADSTLIHVRSDLDGNGFISSTEPSEDVTYALVDSTGVITRDPGTGPAVALSNVTGMSLTYFDSDNNPVVPLPLSVVDAARVRSIGLSITAVDRDSQPFTLTSRVTLRNL